MWTILLLTAFVATVPASNWLIGNWGTTCIPTGPCLIPVGFGLMAPSGVLLIGLALVLRDAVHERVGLHGALAAVLVGSAASLLFTAPGLAVASMAAYLAAEMADLAVYAPLRRRGRALAVAASGLIGAGVDSVLFTYLAFGSTDFSTGNWLGKVYASLAVAALLWTRSQRGGRK